MDSIEVQWSWGKGQAEEFNMLIKKYPDNWLAAVVMPKEYNKQWQEFAYPLKYYLDLEDNVDTKIEIINGIKGLYAKYTPSTTRRGRLKKFFHRSSKSN